MSRHMSRRDIHRDICRTSRGVTPYVTRMSHPLPLPLPLKGFLVTFIISVQLLNVRARATRMMTILKSEGGTR